MGVVVIADDDPDLRELMRRLVSGTGHRAVATGDGVSALELARTESADLVILDNDMPGMTGREVAAALRAADATRALPILLVSGSLSAEDLATGVPDVTACLAKPFRPADIRGYLERLLPAPFATRSA